MAINYYVLYKHLNEYKVFEHYKLKKTTHLFNVYLFPISGLLYLWKLREIIEIIFGDERFGSFKKGYVFFVKKVEGKLGRFPKLPEFLWFPSIKLSKFLNWLISKLAIILMLIINTLRRFIFATNM